MKYTIIIGGVLLLLVLFACKEKAKFTGPIPDNSFLVDVRTVKEFSGGSVPNAVNIPLDEVPSRLEEFSSKDHITVFCRSGNRSGKAKKILNAKGIENVVNGGSWQNVNAVLGSK